MSHDKEQALLALAERVEGASGAYRELDYDIEGTLDGPKYPAGDCPAYTRSLDAAMTLVPEGHHWGAGSNVNWAWVCRPGDSLNKVINAATPALALTAAAIRALATSEAE